MTTTKGGVLANKQGTVGKTAPMGLAVMVKDVNIKKKFEDMLGKKAPGFISSMISVVSNNSLLSKADPRTVLAAAATAAALDLSVNPTLGQAHLVPYKGACQFQISAKGLTQLAIRSNILEDIGCTNVYEGELIKKNRFDGEYIFDEDARSSDVVIGYYAYFKTINGFKKAVYWTKDEVLKHAKKYSKAFNSGPWQTEFDAMARKTVLKDLLLHWAPLSLEMQTALAADNKVVVDNEDGTSDYVDVDYDNTDDSGSDNNAAFSDAAADLGEGPGVDGELFK